MSTLCRKHLWEVIEARTEALEAQFMIHEHKPYNPDQGWGQCSTAMGFYIHGQIKALGDIVINEVFETRSRHRELD